MTSFEVENEFWKVAAASTPAPLVPNDPDGEQGLFSTQEDIERLTGSGYSEWLLVGTDGSAIDTDHPLLARAGAGIFFGQGVSFNVSERVPGPTQSAQAAEVFAVMRVVQMAWRPTFIFSDSSYGVQLVTSILRKNNPSIRAHRELADHRERHHSEGWHCFLQHQVGSKSLQ